MFHRVNELRSTRRGFVLRVFASRASALFLVLASACSGAQQSSERPLRPLAEVRALAVIEEAFRSQNLETHRDVVVLLRSGRTLTIDATIAGHNYGVEYFHDQDRTTVGPSSLPVRAHEDTLLTTTGATTDGRSVEVLVIHDHEYMYEADPDRAGGDRPTQIEVEDRLRRTVADYLAHLRTRGHVR